MLFILPRNFAGDELKNKACVEHVKVPERYSLSFCFGNITVKQCAFIHVGPENTNMGCPNLMQGNSNYEYALGWGIPCSYSHGPHQRILLNNAMMSKMNISMLRYVALV